MRPGPWARAGFVALAFLFCHVATAQDGGFRILYAEPIAPDGWSLRPTTPAKPQASQTLSFQAYGRQFDISLESNDRLLNALPSEQKSLFGSISLYRGRVEGIEGSWVRMLRTNDGELSGQIWDGNDLYTMAAADKVAASLDSSLDLRKAGSIIYRLSDVQSDVLNWLCSVLLPDGTAASSNLPVTYQGLVEALAESVALIPGRQIDVALIADNEFFTLGNSDALVALLGSINFVDGIFSEQVGVALMIPYVEIRQTPAQPFTATDPGLLLRQVGDYRAANAEVRAPGLAHLVTGKDLDGSTVGVAFLSTLCSPESGVSLSEGRFGQPLSALILAHELGHNFGAPHDGEAGSACAATPQTFLMAPTLNSSSQFSACSLQRMAPVVNAASCVVPAELGEVALSSPDPAVLQVIINEPFDYALDVSSIGTGTVRQAVVRTDFASSLTVESVTAPGTSCNVQALLVRCEFSTIDAGTTRRITIRARPNSLSSGSFGSTVFANNDRETNNNSVQRNVQVIERAHADIVFNPPTVNAVADEAASFSLAVTSQGLDPLNGLTVRLLTSLTIESAGGPGINCAPDQGLPTCSLGTLLPGDSRRIDVVVRASSAGSFGVTAVAQANIGSSSAVTSRSVQVNVAAGKDVGVTVDQQFAAVALNQPFSSFATVRSLGIQPAEGVSITVSNSLEIPLDAVIAEGGTCTRNGNNFVCALGTVAPGTQRRIEARARAVSLGQAFAEFRITAVTDHQGNNNLAVSQISVRHEVDVSLTAFGTNNVEGATFAIRADVRSEGVLAPQSNVLNGTVPAALTLISVVTDQGASCTVQANAFSCNRASLAVGATWITTLTLRATDAGDFVIPVTASATGDANLANNSAQAAVHIEALFDVAFIGPQNNRTSLTGIPIELGAFVESRGRDVADVTVHVDLPQDLVLQSTTPGAGTCTRTANALDCELGTLAHLTSKFAGFNVMPGVAGTYQVSFSLRAPLDRDLSNNFRSITVTITQSGDVVLSSADRFTGTANLPFEYAFIITAVGNDAVNDVGLEVDLPLQMTMVSGTADGTTCTFNANGTNTVQCLFGTLSGGSIRNVRLLLRANAAGTFQGITRVGGSNDRDFQNGVLDLTFVIAPDPSPPPRSSNGGGGGGALGWWVIALLGLVKANTSRRRLVAVVREPLQGL